MFYLSREGGEGLGASPPLWGAWFEGVEYPGAPPLERRPERPLEITIGCFARLPVFVLDILRIAPSSMKGLPNQTTMRVG